MMDSSADTASATTLRDVELVPIDWQVSRNPVKAFHYFTQALGIMGDTVDQAESLA